MARDSGENEGRAVTDNQDRHSKRDSESLLMLGGFLVLLSLPVLVGTAFAETSRAMIVNAVAGLTLLAIGAGFVLRSRKLR